MGRGAVAVKRFRGDPSPRGSSRRSRASPVPPLPRLAPQEVVVVELLHLEEAFRGDLAECDALEMAEVLEAFDARGDDDEQVGVGAGDGREGVRAARRDDDEVAPLGADDVLPGQEARRRRRARRTSRRSCRASAGARRRLRR